MASLRTLIVDDEPIARRILREELEQFAGVTIAGEADDGESALTAIQDLLPDLVFLDLQMPGLSGFEVIRNLQPSQHMPVIAICTAWEQHAIQALDAGAIDYLLKPVGHERLAQTVERAQKLQGHPSGIAEQLANLQEIASSSQTRSGRRIVARSGDDYIFLNTDEVLAFEADGDVVWIITARKRYLATQTLKVIQERLRNSTFRRVHRNALVNVDHIRKMSALTSQRWLITLSNNQEFIVSKRQARTVADLTAW